MRAFFIEALVWPPRGPRVKLPLCGRELPPRLQDGAGRDRLEAPRLALSVRPLARLAQVQEPGGTGDEARGRRGLTAMTRNGCAPLSGVGLVGFVALSG